MTFERYTTPDGTLTLVVQRDGDDMAVGFDRCAWHTHADIIQELRHDSDQEQALQRYLDDLFTDKLRIVILKKIGKVHDVWIPDFQDDPDTDPYMEPDEKIEARFGRKHEQSAEREWNRQLTESHIAIAFSI